MQREKKVEKNRAYMSCGIISNGVAFVKLEYQRKSENRAEVIFEEITASKFPKLMTNTKL